MLPSASAKESVKTSSSGAMTSRNTPVTQKSRPPGERMQRRKVPPGRRSMSQYGIVKPSGPHQRLTRSGSVHARNTSSRGTSKSRVTTSSSGRGSPPVATLPLPPYLLQVVVQTIEAFFPETTVTLHPVGGLLQRPRLEPARPRLRHATARDQTGPLEHLQVLGDARKAHLKRLGQLLDGGLTGGEPNQDLPPGRVRKGRKRAVKRIRRHFM